MKQRISVGVIAIIFCWMLSSYAQVNTATISGTVTDATKGVLPGAKVVVLNEETGIARTAQKIGRAHV